MAPANARDVPSQFGAEDLRFLLLTRVHADAWRGKSATAQEDVFRRTPSKSADLATPGDRRHLAEAIADPFDGHRRSVLARLAVLDGQRSNRDWFAATNGRQNP